MVICNLTRNLTRSTSCGYNLPEIVDLYLINYEEFSGAIPTISSDTAGCESITAITSADTKVYHIEPTKNSASFEDTLVVEDNGYKYRNASITFNVSGRFDACMHGSLDALALGRYFVVVKTADGNYLGFGRLTPLEAETATFAGGADTNGIQIVLTGNIAESPLPLTEGAVTELLSKVAS